MHVIIYIYILNHIKIMTRPMSPMHLGRPSSHMPHSFVRSMIFMEQFRV